MTYPPKSLTPVEHVCKPSCHNPCLLKDERPSRPRIPEAPDDAETMSVELTSDSEMYCMKIIFRVKSTSEPTVRVPFEVYLHTTQAIELMKKLAVAIAAYFHKASGDLLRLKGRYL